MATVEPMVLTGKVVLITGAARGIGLEVARLCAAKGARVAMVDIATEIHAAAAGIGNASAWQADLSDDTAQEQVLREVQTQLGVIDILVNNAGLLMGGHFEDGDPLRMKRLLDVNLYASLRLTQRVLPSLLARGDGHIVNVYSSAALLAMPGVAVYNASKAGLYAFTRTLQREMRGRGVTLTAFCPGSTATPMTAGMIASGHGPGAQPHHSPALSAAALIRAIEQRRPFAAVSAHPIAVRIMAVLDVIAPRLLDGMWARMADANYFQAAARGGEALPAPVDANRR